MFATSTPKRIDPGARRITDCPGVPVTLSDGQTWYLAASREKIRPEFEGDRFVGITTYRGFPAGVEPVVNELLGATDAPDGPPLDLIVMTAVVLLRAGHNLSADEARELLTLPADRFVDVVGAIGRAISGAVPAGDPMAGPIADTDAPDMDGLANGDD